MSWWCQPTLSISLSIQLEQAAFGDQKINFVHAMFTKAVYAKMDARWYILKLLYSVVSQPLIKYTRPFLSPPQRAWG